MDDLVLNISVPTDPLEVPAEERCRGDEIACLFRYSFWLVQTLANTLGVKRAIALVEKLCHVRYSSHRYRLNRFLAIKE